MPQDDSKQWEHLQSQENGPSWSDLAPLNLHSIQYDLEQSRRPRPRAELPKKATRAAEADVNENGRSWALIPSTGTNQQVRVLF